MGRIRPLCQFIWFWSQSNELVMKKKKTLSTSPNLKRSTAKVLCQDRKKSCPRLLLCSLYLFSSLWCVASKTKTRHITILLYLDGNNYIFWSKQPKMHTNTYFPVSPEPQIMPKSYLACSRLDAVMIYSRTFSCLQVQRQLSRSLSD